MNTLTARLHPEPPALSLPPCEPLSCSQPPGAEFPSLGSAPPSWVVLGKLWPLGSYGLPDQELQPVVSG